MKVKPLSMDWLNLIG